MHLKLTNEELNALITELRNCEKVTFNTKLEAKLCGAVLKEFLVKLMKKTLDLKKSYKLDLNQKTILCLDHVLPQLWSENVYNRTVIAEIHLKINQLCLNI